MVEEKEEKEEKQPDTIELSVQTQGLLQQLVMQRSLVDEKIELVLGTVRAEKGNPAKKYTLSTDGKSLVEWVGPKD